MTTRAADRGSVEDLLGNAPTAGGTDAAGPPVLEPGAVRTRWWPRGGRAWARFALPPLGAFVLAQVVLYVAAVRDHSTSDYFSPAHWTRWDSGIYLNIASHGYSLTHCAGPQYAPHSLCGSIGWAPLYPWLIAGLGHLGLSLPVAGMVLAWLFAYLTLQALWVLFGPDWSFSKLCCLALAACFPGMVYSYALFPVSLLTFLSVLCLLLFIRRHYFSSGLVGAVCAFAFATGPLVAGVLFVSALLIERGRRRWRALFESAGVAAAGYGLLLLGDQRWVGTWKATFQVQSAYANGLHNPVGTFIDAFTGGTPGKYIVQSPNPGYHYLIPQAQTAFVALLVIVLAVWTLWRRPVSRAQWVVLSYTFVVWLVPLVDGPTLGRYRMEALLVPCTALCLKLPRPIQVVLLGTSVVLAVGLTSLFTRFILI